MTSNSLRKWMVAAALVGCAVLLASLMFFAQRAALQAQLQRERHSSQEHARRAVGRVLEAVRHAE